MLLKILLVGVAALLPATLASPVANHGLSSVVARDASAGPWYQCYSGKGQNFNSHEEQIAACNNMIGDNDFHVSPGSPGHLATGGPDNGGGKITSYVTGKAQDTNVAVLATSKDVVAACMNIVARCDMKGGWQTANPADTFIVYMAKAWVK